MLSTSLVVQNIMKDCVLSDSGVGGLSSWMSGLLGVIWTLPVRRDAILAGRVAAAPCARLCLLISIVSSGFFGQSFCPVLFTVLWFLVFPSVPCLSSGLLLCFLCGKRKMSLVHAGAVLSLLDGPAGL